MSGTSRVRVVPGTPKEVGFKNSTLALIASRSAGADRRLNAFMTLARHRRLFPFWLRFARQLIRRGELPLADTELLILRVSHNCQSEYQWRQHVGMGERAGLPRETIDRVAGAAPGEGFDGRQAALLRAADELHRDRRISDSTWLELTGFLSDVQLIELCMVVGHYEMLAMTLKSLGVVPDPA
jgi:4-carboxymuconolactone decarboxylase